MNSAYDILLDPDANPDFKGYFIFGKEQPIEILPNFNTINIFVGSNNSGKSRFMRTLMKEQKIIGKKSDINFLKINSECNKIIENLKIEWARKPNIYGTNTQPEIVNRINGIFVSQLNFKNTEYFLDATLTQFQSNHYQLEQAQELVLNSATNYYTKSNTTTQIEITDEFKQSLVKAIELSKELISNYKIKKIGTNLNYFIPTLRTAHSLFEKPVGEKTEHSKLKKDIFLDTLIKNYDLKKFVNESPILEKKDETSAIKKIYIFTGINLYNQIVNARNGKRKGREDFEKFEKFIGKQFFNTEAFEIVAQLNTSEKQQNIEENEIINISIEDDDGKNLYELGDGIQSLIILMYSIFMAPDNTVIFIDEPELNLHPGMQRLFLEQITHEDLTKKNLTYVIATHSNHFLDLTIEKDNISVYSFSKNKDNRFLIKNVNAGDNELLRELGVNNSSVFLANCSIWVEGISDRNYIKSFLIAYCKKIGKPLPKEDIDFAFLEYAGSNLAHYDFDENEKESIKAFALNNRILILADNDKGKEEKHKKYKKICELNQENLKYETTAPYREIENLLNDEVWENVLIDLCDKKKVKKDESGIQESIVKAIEKLPIIKFNAKYIGEYLKSLEIKALNNVYELIGDSPQSLKSDCKTRLSKIILDKTIKGELNWESFSKKNPTVLELTKSIYNFIMKK